MVPRAGMRLMVLSGQSVWLVMMLLDACAYRDYHRPVPRLVVVVPYLIIEK